MVRLDWQGSWTRGRFHFTCCHSWIPSLSKVNKTKKCSVMEALLLRPRWHSFRGRIPGSAWRVVLGDTQKETPLNVMWNDSLISWFWNAICFHCWNNLASKQKENGKSSRSSFPALKDTAWLVGGWESCPCVTCPSATVRTWGYHHRRRPCTSGLSSSSWICSWNKSE